MVFQTVVLCSGRHSRRAGVVPDSFCFQHPLRSQIAGGRARLEPARANGIGQCNPGSQRKDLWPNLRRESRNSALREVTSRPRQRRRCRRGREILRTPRLRFTRDHSRRVEKSDRRSCAPRRQHHHTTTGAQQFLSQRKNISPEAAGDFPGQTH